ncbi:MAG: hypothetical protein HN403_14525 [Rhodospirillales bacterium]|jgi:hypothetical protein|nr:hypothetical protein [Rhodospirillales bacterium]
MDNLDRMISEALDDEDREILDKIGRDQGYFEQAVGLFSGKDGLLNALIFIWHLVFFLGGAYAAYKFFTLTDVLEAMRWGMSSAVLLLAALITKVSIFPSMQANRVLRALKHLEMQVALLAARR